MASNLFLENIERQNNADASLSIIGQYGEWANRRNAQRLPILSFRNKQFNDLKSWQSKAKQQTLDRMGHQPITETPTVKVVEQLTYDGLHIEKLTWQLPYGRATEAVLLKPANATGKLPAVLALHDHGGNKYFGTRKIIKTSDNQHPMMTEHQAHYYGGKAWANELAKRGYVVLVSDSFTFGSRRVMLQDVPERLRNKLTDNAPEKQENIDAYNTWASNHEHTMAKSLFSAGTSWPAVFLAEDQKALDILCARPDVDASKVGCCGLSGGGLRSVYLGGLDERVKCAIPVGFMTTWADFSLNKSFTHTWMTYIPMLPNELDFPEILGLRTPLPTLVLNDKEDQLFTLTEMQKADAILGEVYQKANAADRYRCTFYDGPHKFDQPMQAEAFAWFDKWLK
ncbi:MAG: alpha/beta hydrolase family protein [Spirosomaceae bacterium]|nr:alpha/beta hydrolase family protein [Spirosomataceae bacterium]